MPPVAGRLSVLGSYSRRCSSSHAMLEQYYGQLQGGELHAQLHQKLHAVGAGLHAARLWGCCCEDCANVAQDALEAVLLCAGQAAAAAAAWLYRSPQLLHPAAQLRLQQRSSHGVHSSCSLHATASGQGCMPV
jgi:hypothetical protein